MQRNVVVRSQTWPYEDLIVSHAFTWGTRLEWDSVVLQKLFCVLQTGECASV